jgi:malate dehydrogenase
MPNPKITVIGAGNVGASVAQLLLAQHLGDVVMVDIADGLARGKALDLNQSGPVLGFTGKAQGASGFENSVNSDIIVVTSGSPRKPGMSRDDLLKINVRIVHEVVGHAAAASPDAVIIVVTNPLDAMAYTAWKVSNFPKQRVVGMAGILDSARFRWFIADALNVSPLVVDTLVLGGHGDEMVPCLSLARVAGVPLADLLPPEQLAGLVERTRQGGGEIVKLLQTGSAYYAPAASAVRMVASILHDEKAILPCAAVLEGEYGYTGLVLGVPVVLGRNGVEKIMELKLSADDQAALAKSAGSVRSQCRQVDELLKDHVAHAG